MKKCYFVFDNTKQARYYFRNVAADIEDYKIKVDTINKKDFYLIVLKKVRNPFKRLFKGEKYEKIKICFVSKESYRKKRDKNKIYDAFFKTLDNNEEYSSNLFIRYYIGIML